MSKKEIIKNSIFYICIIIFFFIFSTLFLSLFESCILGFITFGILIIHIYEKSILENEYAGTYAEIFFSIFLLALGMINLFNLKVFFLTQAICIIINILLKIVMINYYS